MIPSNRWRTGKAIARELRLSAQDSSFGVLTAR